MQTPQSTHLGTVSIAARENSTETCGDMRRATGGQPEIFASGFTAEPDESFFHKVAQVRELLHGAPVTGARGVETR